MSENEQKLRALLAEARTALSQGCWNGKCCTVRKAIDDALAETAPTVIWAPDPFWGGDAVEARVTGCYIDVHPMDDEEEFPWQWSVSRTELAECGEAKTKQEAMEAALKFVKEKTR